MTEERPFNTLCAHNMQRDSLEARDDDACLDAISVDHQHGCSWASRQISRSKNSSILPSSPIRLSAARNTPSNIHTSRSSDHDTGGEQVAATLCAKTAAHDWSSYLEEPLHRDQAPSQTQSGLPCCHPARLVGLIGTGVRLGSAGHCHEVSESLCLKKWATHQRIRGQESSPK